MSEPRTGSAARSIRQGGEPDRVLGRGLEDVSHLFLTRVAKHEREPPVKESGARPVDDPVPNPAPPTSTPLVLRPAAAVTTDQLAAMLMELNGLIETGLTLIDEKLPCAAREPVDLVGIDHSGRLTFIDFDTRPNNLLLLRGIGHLDWALSNGPTLQRMYAGCPIQFSLPPRVLLLAPDFSPLFGIVLRRVALPQLECLKYQLVDLPDGLGILFERRALSRHPDELT